MIFETHCHLFDEAFKDDLKQVISRAQEANVKKMLVLGDDIINSKKAIAIAVGNEGVYAAVGVFPTACHNLNLEETLVKLEELIKSSSKIKCIGEIGLDYYYEKDEKLKEEQRKFFIAQLHLADKYNLPVSIHARDCISDIYQILKDNMPKKGAIMHCFSSSVEMMNEFIKLGAYISLGGPVTFKNAKTPKEVALSVPLNKLLVETDSPYLSPTPLRGQRNEPKNITYVIKEIAMIKGMTFDEIAKATYENALRILEIKA